MIGLYGKLAIAVAVLALTATATYHLYDMGVERERARIERENVNAAGNANEAAMSLMDCLDRNGVYDFNTGKCRWTSADNR